MQDIFDASGDGDTERVLELHRAVKSGVVESVKLLLDSGADYDIKDIDGNTPEMFWNISAEILNLIQEKREQDAHQSEVDMDSKKSKSRTASQTVRR